MGLSGELGCYCLGTIGVIRMVRVAGAGRCRIRGVVSWDWIRRGCSLGVIVLIAITVDAIIMVSLRRRLMVVASASFVKRARLGFGPTRSKKGANRGCFRIIHQNF